MIAEGAMATSGSRRGTSLVQVDGEAKAVELRDAIQKRRSIRRFSSEPVTLEQVKQLIDAAVMAPSSMNAQPWHFTVVAGKVRDEVVETVSKSTTYLADILQTMDAQSRLQAESFVCDLGGAPVIILVSMPHGLEEYQRLVDLLSIGGAVQNLMLEAHDMGLATCNITFSFWVRDELAERVGINGEIVSLVVLGHPGESPGDPGRDREVVDYIGFEGG
jgi:nitroreductase